MKNIANDIKFAWRMLFKKKLFALVGLLTLGICIAGNTFVFTITDSFVLQPLPYPDPDSLVEVYNSTPGYQFWRASSSFHNYKDYQQHLTAFSEIAFIVKRPFNVEQGDVPFTERGHAVSAEFFRGLGVKPHLGRWIDEQDWAGFMTGSEKRIVLAYSVWNKVFKGDRNAIGKTLKVDGQFYEVIGVMPPGFYYEEMDARVWVPYEFPAFLMEEKWRHLTGCNIFARLAPGYTMDDARRQLAELDKLNYEQITTKINRDAYDIGGFHSVVWPLKNRMSEGFQGNLYLLQGGVFIMLIIGCVNVANLLMIRSNDRMGEFAIRSALGAGRKKILRLVLTESMLLSLMGGALGLFVGVAGIVMFDEAVTLRTFFNTELTINFSVLLFTLGISIVAGAVCGGFSLLNVWRRNHNEVLKEDSRTGTSSGFVGAMTSGLVVLQIAMTFAMTYGASVLYTSFSKMMNVDMGFEPKDVYNGKLTLPQERYPNQSDMVRVIGEAQRAIKSIPGVQNASLTQGGPFNLGGIFLQHFAFKDRESKNSVSRIMLGTETTFETLGIDLIDGRNFQETDTKENGVVFIIDTFTKEMYWGDDDPIGDRISFTYGGYAADEDGYGRIVGVVDHLKIRELDLIGAREKGVTYMYYKQQPYRPIDVHVKSTLPEGVLQKLVRDAIFTVDSELPLYDFKSQQQRIDFFLFKNKVFMVSFVICSIMAIMLSIIGIFGLVAYTCSLRTKEIGIRMAIGAKRDMVVALMLKVGMTRIGLGLALGLAATLFIASYFDAEVKGFLFGVSPIEPLFLLGVAAAVAAVGFFATLVPSRKASRTEPVAALSAR